jgi:hypothetical protein
MASLTLAMPLARRMLSAKERSQAKMPGLRRILVHRAFARGMAGLALAEHLLAGGDEILLRARRAGAGEKGESDQKPAHGHD